MRGTDSKNIPEIDVITMRCGTKITSLISGADRKSQVGQCLDFCTADFWSLLAFESAEQKPKHCLN